MITFRPLTLADKDTLLPYLRNSNRRNCDVSFSNLYCWRFMFNTVFAEVDDFLLFKFWINGQVSYMLPFGTGNLSEMILQLKRDALDVERSAKFRLSGICPDQKQLLENLMPQRFSISADRDYNDYLYLRTDLATLTGKKYQPKRNHVNKFRKTYSYEYRSIDRNLIPECLQMEAEWCRQNNCNGQDGTNNERQAVINGLTHFEELGLTGGALFVDGRIVAFTFGMPISHDTFGVHVEKADTRIDGAYAMINYEFANHVPEAYTYLNREEDLGIEGLRKAKLSYHPFLLLEKSVAEWIG
ncbi:MAG: phosphatidylglycerol lysyltransferase domain-containing protein [Prevotellaceae bacterium]|jgi:hypothetical protein|nr:phosphatidylglycerol lysyltransferase domain-containing protein [Prevotellaceae bacterium]